MKIKLTKQQWVEAGQKAGWLKTAGGFGKLSKDIADALEGQVMIHRKKSAEEILAIVTSDTVLHDLIRQDGVDDIELLDYIREMLRFIML